MATPVRIPTYVVLDTETGGLDPRVNPLIQVALIVVDQFFDDIATLSQRIIPDPLMTMDARAVAVNGYNEQEWRETGMEQPAADDYVTQFLFQHFKTRQGIAVAHNASFDKRFFEYHLPKAQAWLHPTWHCTYRQFELWRKVKGQPGKAKLGDLVKAAGIVRPEGWKSHEALSDTRDCLDGLRWLLKDSGLVNWKPVEYPEDIQKLYAA